MVLHWDFPSYRSDRDSVALRGGMWPRQLALPWKVLQCPGLRENVLVLLLALHLCLKVSFVHHCHPQDDHMVGHRGPGILMSWPNDKVMESRTKFHWSLSFSGLSCCSPSLCIQWSWPSDASDPFPFTCKFYIK